MLKYCFDQNKIKLTEEKNPGEIIFQVEILDENLLPAWQQVEAYFENDDDPLDVTFLPFAGNRWHAIMGPALRVRFLLKMFELRLLTSLEWEDKANVCQTL
ncbi:MAG: hypothetical protein ACOY3H_03400 [Bacillota bacterium]|uniref:Uncharacterized protein n=2 Tax=Carboxydocella TaxID=178898 RepID=A0A1T4NBF7_9FIRM|nr:MULTISPECIES: hypothetical protein [Carboxydocella]AVX20972.1 hypothetical protein CFE_1801 [Carboxydocella thermautotrophica]AVX31386.1 hypothetical protein CTH_1814 [Carboxydocella thermautotrophica]SJZ76423.1 hypothetical protein SAMN02745885_00863 [Carboxydocella sporoproducens DSM 16521]GAW28115.1 hypothetical protein ULO1_06850 [Carboxydocella sp. ULO1]GAW30977.1 hypothetical protein JDF658_07420 [Carboxydocella sp. JDF658]